MAETLSDAEKDDITNIVVQWKEIYETVLLSQSDILKNNGLRQILNLMKSKVQIAEMRMKSRIGDGVFSDGVTNTKAFNGLEQIVDETADYGGLSISDITDEDGNNAWLARIDSNSGTDRALSLSLIQKVMGECSIDGDSPTCAVMRQNVFDEVWNLLSPHQRLQKDSSLSGLGHEGGTGDEKVLIYNGIPFIVDSHAAAQKLYFINERYLKLYVHSLQDMKVQSFSQLEDKNAIKKRVLLMANLLASSRRQQGGIEDIAVAS